MQKQHDPSDEVLVHRAIGGDTDAYGQLVERHVGLVYSLAYAETTNAEEAEDVAQDALLRACERISQVRTPDRFVSWLARITVSCARDRQRRSRYEASVRMEKREAGRTESPDTVLPERRELIEKGLRAIPENYRRAVILRYMNGATFKQIANTLLITEAAAEIRVRRSIDMLRQFFSRSGLEEDCRDTLRTHCLAIPFTDSVLTSVRASLERSGATPPVATRPPALSIAGSIAVGVTLTTVLIGSIVSRHQQLGQYADDEGLGVQALTILLHRPVVTISNPVIVDAGAPLISSPNQLDNWTPAFPREDTALPRSAEGAVPDRPDAGVIANDYGVYRSFQPVSGVIRFHSWLMPTSEESDIAVGLLFGSQQHEWERILRRASDREWLFRVGYDERALPLPTRGEITVDIVYHTEGATYDLAVDGVWMLRNVQLVSEFSGRPVRGIFLRSGASFEGHHTYFDDLRVTYAPAAQDPRGTPGVLPATHHPRKTTPTIRLLTTTLNDRTIDGSTPSFTVPAGAHIKGRARIQLHNPHSERATFPIVYVPSWGSRSSSFVTVTPSAPSGDSERWVEITLPPPPRQGVHHIVVAGAAEKEAAHVASGTNWAAGVPIWDNDTDIAGWTPELIETAMRYGAVAPPWLDSRSRRWRTEAGAAVLRVVVESRLPLARAQTGR